MNWFAAQEEFYELNSEWSNLKDGYAEVGVHWIMLDSGFILIKILMLFSCKQVFKFMQTK